MYEQFFGLKELPFSLTPDTGYLYRHAGHQGAVNELLTGLETGEGFLAVVSEVGSGKTLLCRRLLTLLPDHWASVYLPNPLLTPGELYHEIARELGCAPPAGESLRELQAVIFERLLAVHGAGGRVVVMIDEAQSMTQPSLEALRLLSNLETEKNKLLQVVFFAQPEFEKRLSQHALRQLKQRITYTCRIRPMLGAEIEGYLQHRLTVAGYTGPALFSSAALRRLYRKSGGSPRLVNILAHKALLASYGEGVGRISARQVEAAVADTSSVSPSGILDIPYRQFWLGSLSALLLTLLTLYLLKGGE